MRRQVSLALWSEEGVQPLLLLLRVCARSRLRSRHAGDIDALTAQLLFDEQPELVVEYGRRRRQIVGFVMELST